MERKNSQKNANAGEAGAVLTNESPIKLDGGADEPVTQGIGMKMTNQERNELFSDSDQSEDEGIQDYKIGGYHPIHVGEIMVERYLIVQKLGWGHFSTVWLARDLLFNTYVALKVQKSAKNYLEAAYDEVEILDVIAKNTENAEWIKSLIYYHIDNPEQVKKGAISEHCHNVMLLNSF